MNRGVWRLLFLCFLFVFGLLVGLEIKKNNVTVTSSDARDTFIDSSQFISRIENGQLVFVPIHQKGLEQSKQNDLAKKSEVNDKVEHDPVDQRSKLKMNKEGKLDQIGQKLGSKFSQLARNTLEMSFSLFTK